MTKARWTDKKAGKIQIEYNPNHIFELTLNQEGIEYFNQKGCSCRPLPVKGLDLVMISGVDDCPVHGVGAAMQLKMDL